MIEPEGAVSMLGWLLPQWDSWVGEMGSGLLGRELWVWEDVVEGVQKRDGEGE